MSNIQTQAEYEAMVTPLEALIKQYEAAIASKDNAACQRLCGEVEAEAERIGYTNHKRLAALHGQAERVSVDTGGWLGKPLYLRAEDLVSACIGPFTSLRSAVEHWEFCQQRGDGAAFKSISDVPPNEDDILIQTPEEDRNFKDEA